MSEYDRNDPAWTQAVQNWSEINAALKALEDKTDVESSERREELLEALMCADMALGPMRKAMGKSNDAGNAR